MTWNCGSRVAARTPETLRVSSAPVRSADAIHLATAIRLQSDAMVAYDIELLAAAANAGLSTLVPGHS